MVDALPTLDPDTASVSATAGSGADAIPFVVATGGAHLAGHDHPGQGEPVLLLHGGPGCPDYLGPVAAMLAPRHRAIRFDQRGVGASATLDGRYDVDAYVADIEAIRGHLGVERWHVFGHSWGGLLAQLYTHAHPERVVSLFLCSAALGVGDEWRWTRRTVLRHALGGAGPRAAAATAFWYLATWLPGRLGAMSARRLFRHAWRHAFPNPRQALPPDEGWVRGVNREALHGTEAGLLALPKDALPRAWDNPPPVLVLYGGQDIFGKRDGIVRQRFAAGAQVRLDASGHLPWLQDHAAFRDVLTAFYAD